MNPQKVYKKLYKHFGPQGWWPIFDKKTGKCEYRGGAHLSDGNKFEICVGAILTQNTAWKNVERALANLAVANCLSPEKICRARNLATLIKPAGYYNQKAKKLKIFARYWLKKSLPRLASGTPFAKGRKLNLPLSHSQSERAQDARTEGDFVSDRNALLSLWGIGPETADSMLLYAAKRPVFVVDAYTKRLCGLLGVKFAKYDDYRAFFESHLPHSAKLYNEYHALIVAWGKMYGNKKTRTEAVRLLGRSGLQETGSPEVRIIGAPVSPS